MREGWKAVYLGAISNVIAGQSPKGSAYNDSGDGLPFYQGKKQFSEKYIGEPTSWTTHVTKEAFPGDILMSVRAPVGPVNFAASHCCIGRGLAAIQAGSAVDKDFLFYALIWRQPDIKGNEGAVFSSINRKQIEGLEIPLPDIGEQKRIVAILDEAFEGIDTVVTNTEKNLANVQELFDGYLSSVFSQRSAGWIDQPLKDVCVDYGRGKSKHRPRNDPRLYGGEYPFIQTGDVRKSSHVIQDYSATYNEAGLAQSKLWPEGTICITIAANIAETGILGFDACFPDSIIGMVVDEKKASKEYVEYLLQSVKTVLKAKGKGSAQDNINLGTFENEKFPFPPLEKQEEIALNLHELSSTITSLEAIYQQKLTALVELKQTLLHKAFSGELTATEVEAAVVETTV